MIHKKLFAVFCIFAFASSHLLTEEELDQPAITQELIQTINSSNASFIAGENSKFAFATKRDIVRLLGRKLQGNSFDLLETKTYSLDKINDLPDSFNLIEAYPDCPSIGHLLDQSSCGSCWANAASGVMSDRICIKSNGSNKKIISAADIMSCCKTCGNGCDGGDEALAFVQWSITGWVSGGDFGDKNTCKPYSFPKCDHHVVGKYPPCSGDYPTPECKKECQSGYETPYSQDKSRGTAYKISKDEKQIRTEIQKNGSVTAAFHVYEDFMSYKYGVYHHVSGKYLGDHAVRIIGWGIENGIAYWLVANSWNEDWGDKGFFKIKRGSNEVGIEAYIATGSPLFNNENSELKFLEN